MPPLCLKSSAGSCFPEFCLISSQGVIFSCDCKASSFAVKCPAILPRLAGEARTHSPALAFSGESQGRDDGVKKLPDFTSWPGWLHGPLGVLGLLLYLVRTLQLENPLQVQEQVCEPSCWTVNCFPFSTRRGCTGEGA